MEGVEKRKQLFHTFHRPLEIPQERRDFHIPTAPGGGSKTQILKPQERMTQTMTDANAEADGIPIGRQSCLQAAFQAAVSNT